MTQIYSIYKMIEDIDILNFDPSELSVHFSNSNTNDYYYKRKPTYPYNNVGCSYESSTNNPEDIIGYVLNAMTRNSIEHENLLMKGQYDKKDDFHDKHHSSWERQVLDWKFYSNIYSKMDKIIRCVQRLKENANTYSISKQTFNTWKANMTSYIWNTESKKYQIEWFVEGLMKFIFSAVWDYTTLSWILENPICSFRYQFSTEKWTKINDN